MGSLSSVFDQKTMSYGYDGSAGRRPLRSRVLLAASMSTMRPDPAARVIGMPTSRVAGVRANITLGGLTI
jgi:hypothetical protein